MLVAVDDRGSIYISDSGNFKLKKFDQQGRLLGSIGSEGDGPGQFRKAAGVDVDRDGKVYVLDSGKNTLQILACEPGDAPLLSPASPLPSVEVLNDISSRGVNALAMDKRLWGLSGDSLSAVGVIAGRKIGSTGSEPGQLKNPAGFAIDGRGNFWVADTGNNRLQKFSLEGNLLQVVGKSGAGEGEFRAPSAVAVSSRGSIFVADTGNKRIQGNRNSCANLLNHMILLLPSIPLLDKGPSRAAGSRPANPMGRPRPGVGYASGERPQFHPKRVRRQRRFPFLALGRAPCPHALGKLNDERGPSAARS